MTRREMLGLLGASAAALLRSGPRQSGAQIAPSTAQAAVNPSCIIRPEQTEGPYFIDEQLNRSDIRSDPTNGSVTQGAPLGLAFQVSRVVGGVCSPLGRAIVDIWQCDALGVYSDVRDLNGRFDTTGKKFLRGYQATNANGLAEFLTIYPGWYGGRAVHIHFKIRADPASRRAYEFTSQLYFDESITDQVYKRAPYNAKERGRTTNDADFLFQRGGKQLMLRPTKDAVGYRAQFDIGLLMT